MRFRLAQYRNMLSQDQVCNPGITSTILKRDKISLNTIDPRH
jgi:hypothetical protein